MTSWRWIRPRPGAPGAALGWLGAALLRALGATWRISYEGPDPLDPDAPAVLGAFWHRSILIAAFVYRDRAFGATVSRSRDGDLITALLHRLGYAPSARGSSSRGGAAVLRGSVRFVRAGHTIAVPTDGPRGPARRSKLGIVALARLTGAPIAPIAFSASPCLRFRSWDRTLLPLPFARVLCCYAPWIRVDRDADDRAEEAALAGLDEALNALTNQLDDRTGLRDAKGSSTTDDGVTGRRDGRD